MLVKLFLCLTMEHFLAVTSIICLFGSTFTQHRKEVLNNFFTCCLSAYTIKKEFVKNKQ